MSSEIIIQNVAYDKLWWFLYVLTSYFHEISFHYFEDLI
jgi:hypothetical protein